MQPTSDSAKSPIHLDLLVGRHFVRNGLSETSLQGRSLVVFAANARTPAFPWELGLLTGTSVTADLADLKAQECF